MKRQTASCMLEWFVYTVVAVGFGRGGLADAGRRRGLDGRVDHAGTVCGPAGACGALLPVPEHRRVGRHAPAGLAFPGDGQAWVVYGRLAEPTDAGMGPGCPLSRPRGHSRGRMAEGPGRRMEDAIRVFPPLMPTWQGTDWRRTWGRPFPCRLWGSDYEGHLVQGVPPVHVV